MQIHNLNFEPYISAEHLAEQTARVAAQINRDYALAETPPLILITLGGAVIYAADLVRRLDFMTELSYVKCSSYNDGISSTGQIKMEIEPTISPVGRDVIVVEDIVDTGNTYVALHDYLMRAGAKSVKIATMLIKTAVYKKELPIDYISLEIDDIFVVGSGLDYNQLGRNLAGIYRLSK